MLLKSLFWCLDFALVGEFARDFGISGFWCIDAERFHGEYARGGVRWYVRS